MDVADNKETLDRIEFAGQTSNGTEELAETIDPTSNDKSIPSVLLGEVNKQTFSKNSRIMDSVMLV